ncbi:transposase [Idiomarina sp.]|uniref:transposase n=1 Tax=Idiomarina sp. TaxID=1874361 RepID=UPI0025C3E94A|nr:transposase [Idiomarina sp.]MCJ8316189.1 hypothetical protein [Idiomarina sp.]
MIAIEDLRVSNLSKSAKGDTEEHGKSVKAKSGLNKSILDQGWHEFRRQLEYKQLWNGGLVVAVPAQYTSPSLRFEPPSKLSIACQLRVAA